MDNDDLAHLVGSLGKRLEVDGTYKCWYEFQNGPMMYHITGSIAAKTVLCFSERNTTTGAARSVICMSGQILGKKGKYTGKEFPLNLEYFAKAVERFDEDHRAQEFFVKVKSMLEKYVQS